VSQSARLEVFEELRSRQPPGGWPIDVSRVSGYSEDELWKIEKLYDIKLLGAFRKFMNEMGRCGGGLIGDDPVILYRPAWPVRTQILFQIVFFGDMQNIGAFEYLDKPFVFSLESETQYYFLRTGSDTPELVYHYDENNKTVQETGLNFMNYMRDAIRRYRGYGREFVCQGELLNIA
jgi:hypothetical protein